MAIKRTMHESEFTSLEPGTYGVTCVGIKEDVIENPQFGNGDVIRFSLRFEDVLNEEGEEVTRDAIANDKLTPMSKLTSWLAAFGVKVAVGEEVNLEECIGKKALAVVGLREKDGKSYDRIENLLPAKRTRKAAEEGTMSISDWWAKTRELGIARAKVLEVAQSAFGNEPMHLTPEERQTLLDTLAN